MASRHDDRWLITAVLLHVIAVERWKLAAAPLALAITFVFLTIDLTFFGANLLKLFQGGWLPILIGACIFTVMTTWKTGRRVVAERLVARAIPIDHFLEVITAAPPLRVPGTAVFMTAQAARHSAGAGAQPPPQQILTSGVVVLTVNTAPVPHVADDERSTVDSLGFGISASGCGVRVHGRPARPNALHAAGALGLDIDLTDITISWSETILARAPGMARWRKKLFVVMTRNRRPRDGGVLPPAAALVEFSSRSLARRQTAAPAPICVHSQRSPQVRRNAPVARHSFVEAARPLPRSSSVPVLDEQETDHATIRR